MTITKSQAQAARSFISKTLDLINQAKIKAKQKKCKHWINAIPNDTAGVKAFEKFSAARKHLIELRRHEKVLIPVLKHLRQIERGVLAKFSREQYKQGFDDGYYSAYEDTEKSYNQGFDAGFDAGLKEAYTDESSLWEFDLHVDIQNFNPSEFEEVAEALTERGIVKVFASDCDDEKQSVFCTEIDTLCFNKNSDYPYHDSENEDLWKYVQLVIDNDE